GRLPQDADLRRQPPGRGVPAPGRRQLPAGGLQGRAGRLLPVRAAAAPGRVPGGRARPRRDAFRRGAGAARLVGPAGARRAGGGRCGALPGCTRRAGARGTPGRLPPHGRRARLAGAVADRLPGLVPAAAAVPDRPAAAAGVLPERRPAARLPDVAPGVLARRGGRGGGEPELAARLGRLLVAAGLPPFHHGAAGAPDAVRAVERAVVGRAGRPAADHRRHGRRGGGRGDSQPDAAALCRAPARDGCGRRTPPGPARRVVGTAGPRGDGGPARPRPLVRRPAGRVRLDLAGAPAVALRVYGALRGDWPAGGPGGGPVAADGDGEELAGPLCADATAGDRAERAAAGPGQGFGAPDQRGGAHPVGRPSAAAAGVALDRPLAAAHGPAVHRRPRPRWLPRALVDLPGEPGTAGAAHRELVGRGTGGVL